MLGAVKSTQKPKSAYREHSGTLDVIEQFLFGVFASLLGAAIPLLVMYRLRGKILRSSLRFASETAPDEIQDLILGAVMTWEDKKDDKGVVTRHYTPKPLLINFIASVMPVAVEIGWRAFGGKLSGLPLGTNPDGTPKLNMLAGPMKKMMDGKKVSFDDFVPEIMVRVMPFIEQMAQKLGGALGGAVGGKPGAVAPDASGGFKPV